MEELVIFPLTRLPTPFLHSEIMARTLRERKRCHPFSLSYVNSRAGEGMRRAEAPLPVLFLSSLPVFKER